MRSSQIVASVWLAFPLIAWGANNISKRRRLSFWLLVLGTTIMGYFLFLFSSRLSGYELKTILDAYDFDGDGLFSGVEITPQMQEAMRAYTTDMGRVFAPVTAGAISLIWTLLIFGACNLTKWSLTGLLRKASICRGRKADS